MAAPALVPSHWFGREGSPSPLGATFVPADQAFNFALYSRRATNVTLLLYTDADFENPSYQYTMRHPANKTGRVWHCRVPASQAAAARYYAYRVEGPAGTANGNRFDPDKVLLDPYAHAVFFPPNHSRLAASQPGSNAGRAPLGVLPAVNEPFDWGGDRKPRHAHDTIVYEMHVKGFTARENSGVSAGKRGTYSGVIEKIPYLKELGVTVVELLPVQQFDPKEGNYWGYMTLNFFSPHCAYAADKSAGAQLDEFRSMVKAFHEAGIEVILDVVYNHTTEDNERGPNYSYRGIDNSTYYLLERDMVTYRNDAGTGNVLHCANAATHRMIVESLRFWVEEMHVDGFRFDLASIFTRRSDGSINIEDPPIVSEISSDKAFENIRLIAEAWDLATYQLGRQFPGQTWLQWNGRFRDEMRQFIRSDNDRVGLLMRRLYGSDDLFPDERELGYRPFQSVNYFCSHDGFNMRDLVSYNQKRNANGGTDDNHSWNCGWEGDGNVPGEVVALRKRQVKNMCALLMLANGTPMFCAGDEFMNTQRGNNNPYNEDNEITWLDWSLAESHSDVLRFFRKMIAFRKAHPSIGRSTFWREDIRWYGVGPDVDMSFTSHSLAYCLRGASQGDNDIYVMINAYWEPLDFTIQEGAATEWTRVADTSLPSPDDIPETGSALAELTYRVGPRSVAVFLRR
jgi:glycogen operon protein